MYTDHNGDDKQEMMPVRVLKRQFSLDFKSTTKLQVIAHMIWIMMEVIKL